MSDESKPTADDQPTMGVPPFNRHPTTNRLIDMFAATAPGDLVTYAEIEHEAGCTRDAWQNCMTTVRKVLAERYSIRLACETGVGYRHLTDEDVAGSTSSRDVSTLHRAAGRRARALVGGIKDKSKIPHAKLAQLRLVEHATSPKATKVLESTKVENGKFDVSATLDAFRKRLPGKATD